MNLETLKHIQTICKEWLAVASSGEVRLTILSVGALVQTVEIKLRSFITPHNTIITSAVDAVTGANYVSLVEQNGIESLFIEATLDEIPKSLDDRLLEPGNPPSLAQPPMNTKPAENLNPIR